jgi:hypothetical protein
MNKTAPLWLAILLALAGCAAAPAAEEAEAFAAQLSGAQEVPPVSSPGNGKAEVVFSHRTGTIKWRVTFQGLSGPLTAAHLHGPATPGQNAAVVVPFTGELNAPPLQGEVRITPEQFSQLASGQWYVNLHTARHPQGELRGQLRPLSSR